MAEVTNNKVDYLSTLNAGSGLNTTQIIDALVDAEINNEYAATMEDKDRDDVGISSFWDLVRRDLDWFRQHNAKAYMVLLD